MIRTYTLLHCFSGIGGNALGAAGARAVTDDHEAVFRNIGGIDFDPLACKDFERLTGAPALCADIHELEPADLRRFVGNTPPDVAMSSPPCKGLSALLGAKRAAEPKYQKMNQLLGRALFLLCSTWDRPPDVIFFENVPRIRSRGRHVVEQATKLLQAHGYAVHTGTHDCGEIGNLAQHRERWFLMARQRTRIRAPIHLPTHHPVRACGEVLGPLPMPGDTYAGGAMHALPGISWLNWCRLSLIPAGGDWRDLPHVMKPGQKRRELFRRDPVARWDDPAATVTGPGGSAAGNVADPRFTGESTHVTPWDAPTRTVTGNGRVRGSGASVVADPRVGHLLADNPGRHYNKYSVGAWDQAARTVIGASRPGSGAPGVADPRFNDGKRKNWQMVAGVTGWGVPAPTVTGNAKIHAGPFQVADPRVLDFVDGLVREHPMGCRPRAGAYRVLSWRDAAPVVTGSLAIDNGAAAVADPRHVIATGVEDLPRLRTDRAPPWTPVIIAADGTWHRPLTTFELLALQGFPLAIDGVPLVLEGTSHTRWREAIGNAVPPPAARAIADVILMSLLLSTLGRTIVNDNGIWTRPEHAFASFH